MQFFEHKKHIRKVKDDYYVIGTRPLDPLITIDGKKLIVNEISPTYILDTTNTTGAEGYVLTTTSSGITWKESTAGGAAETSSVTGWVEAFEEDANGDIMPSNSEYVSDPMWLLKAGGNLELRANHWRYDTGPTAFTEDIAF